jgi:Gram-negative porin
MLADAGALLALSSTANAGITIPAGDWTIDVSGNVNAYANWTSADKVKGTAPTGGLAGTPDATGEKNTQGINTGLLPAWLSLSGKTRQNDLDVQWLISFQPNVSDQGGAVHGDSSTPLNRQAYFSFGDASWGSVKLGKDIGIFASDAILNDMTLLGVGGGAANSGAATTLGGIGSGYIYAGWKGQIAYTSPNWNGFQFTAGITNPNQIAGDDNSTARTLYQDRFGYEGKASYAWTGDVSGKVWVSAATYDVTVGTSSTVGDSYKANAWDLGATVNVAGFGLTGYYYDGKGVGTTLFGNLGAQYSNGVAKRRDSNGGYVQATYVLPTQTKIGVAYGKSTLDNVAGDAGTLIEENKRWTVGAYHPLTKSVNLVAEYNRMKSEGQVSSNKTESDTFSLGGILFF